MAVLEKIRVKFGLAISIIIALALLSFIIDPSTLESALQSMSKKYDVGQIAGKNISYTDFQSDIDRYTTINQLVTGSSVQDEQTQVSLRNAAWQELLDKYMFVKNAKAAGIKVGDAEMVDLTSGNNISPVLSQNAAFLDESGAFSKDALVSFVQNVSADESGQLRTYWNYLQTAVYNQQFYAKYAALFNASSFLNDLEVADAVAANNTTADVDYCLVNYPAIPDSTLSVSSNEIKSYYNEHKNFFKQNASRDIEYVVYEVVPSDDDIAATSTAMNSIYDEFCTTDNMKAFLLKNSEMPLSTYWYKAGELSTVNADIDNAIFGGAAVTPVLQSGNVFLAGRELETKMVPDSAYVKHILLQGTDAKEKADSLVNVIKKGGNFTNLAASYSADQNSSADGELGSIGWMTQNYMISGFESVLTAKVGEPFVLTTQYGTHVVLVTKQTKPVVKKQVAILEKTALAGQDTFNNYYSKANNFATLTHGSYEGYKKALDSTKVYSHALNVTEATSSYGSIDQAKEVTRWIFDNKAGKASNIITVNNNYFFIVAVKDIHKEGYAPIKDAASSIRTKLLNDKTHDKVASEVAEKINGASSIADVASRLGSTVEHSEGMSLASVSVDPALLGAVAGATEGKISAPVKGVMGVYVVDVANKQTGEFYTAADAKNLAAQKASYMSQMITSVMQEYDKVKDNRERFF